MSRPEKVQAALRLMGDPYASLSLISDEEEPVNAEPTFAQKQAYFKRLENPHSFSEIFGDSDDNLWQAAVKRQKNDVFVILEKELDEVLILYEPHVARSEWNKLKDFRPDFIKRASETREQADHVLSGLQKFKFSLAPGEKVEYNRALASRIIGELEKLLA